MPQPFTVRSQTNPGVDLFSVRASGNVDMSGALRLANLAAAPTAIPGQPSLYAFGGALWVLDGNGVVSPVLAATTTPSDNAFLAWTVDPANAGGTTILPTTGSVNLVRVNIDTPATISVISIGITVAGANLTGGQNWLGLYDAAGTRLAQSADQSAAFATTGIIGAALTTPYPAVAGHYYIAILAAGLTLPTLARSTIVAANAVLMANAGLTAATARVLAGPAAQPTLPAAINLGAQSTNAVASWWAALS